MMFGVFAVVRSFALIGAFAISAAVLAQPAQAAVNLIQNGNFDSTTLAGSNQFGSGYSANQLTGWTTAGYNFVFAPGTADTTGATGQYGNVRLWGPNDAQAVDNTTTHPVNTANSSASPSTALPSVSPNGGNYVGADGSSGFNGAITQTVNGLVVGAAYQLNFYWAAAQQYGYYGPTTDMWNVTFGNQVYNTAVAATTSQGFSGWRLDGVVFTATAASQTLSFLAQGTPSGVPPFALLDGVTLVAAPEPATWALMMVGVAGICFLVRRRRSGGSAAA